MSDICKQILDIMVIPIPLFENPRFNEIWVDILEYTVIHEERLQTTDDFPLCLSALFEWLIILRMRFFTTLKMVETSYIDERTSVLQMTNRYSTDI